MNLLNYLHFTRQQWCHFRKNTPLPLTEKEILELSGQIEVVSPEEVQEIYLPLSRLLSLYVIARQGLYHAAGQFLGKSDPKVPYVIGVSGSVAVGKSTTSRILRALLSRWPNHPQVDIMTTDAFLWSNAVLEKRQLMHRKGFPESYRLSELLNALRDIKSGKREISIPVYSHYHYDILPQQFEIIDQPDILIVEGINILHTGSTYPGSHPTLFVSDFFDFSLFVDAEPHIIQKWYIERLLSFWQDSFKKTDNYFNFLSAWAKEEVMQFASRIWHETNEINLVQNILPYRERAQLILTKGENHRIDEVYLRKL